MRIRLTRSLTTKVALMGSTLYVSAVSVWAHEGEGPLLFFLVVLALVCAYLAARTLDRSRNRALALFGLALSLATEDAGGHRVVFAICGAGLASVIAIRAVLSAEGTGGLSQPTRRAWPLDRVAIGLWSFALVLAVKDALAIPGNMHVSVPTMSGFALGGTYALLGLACVDRVRRAPTELGAHVRAFSSLVILGCAALLGIFVATASDARFSPLEVSLALGSVLVVQACEHTNPLRTVVRARRAMTLMLFAGPVVFIAAQIADGTRMSARVALVIAAVVTAIIAWYTPLLEEPFLPAKGTWLRAFEKAEAALTQKSDEEALAAVLALLREAGGPKGRRPEIYLLYPARILTVNSAGNLREEPGEAPPLLIELAKNEPEATLRAVALRPLYVRRPDLRSLSTWMDDASLDVATVITHDGEAEGLLALGFGARTDAFTLEETCALKHLADKLAAVCAMRAKTTRGLLREQELKTKIEESEDAILKLEHARGIEEGRHAATTARLAEPVTLGFYSPTSRLAYEAIERRVALSAPVVVVAPSGVDAVPYLARAHLTGSRKNKPFVVVEGTRTREHDVARWTDPASSPFSIADGGLLVFSDGAALPRDVQALIARTLAERRVPWPSAELLDVAIAFASVHDGPALADVLDPSLFARLEDGAAHAIALPRLSERHEDLRAIVTDRLAREGLRVRGAPVGIDDRAFAALLEYSFPGEDAELRAIATKLVAHLVGDVVRASDVVALGLVDVPADEHGGPRVFLVK